MFEEVSTQGDPRLLFANFTSSLLIVNSTLLTYAALGLLGLAGQHTDFCLKTDENICISRTGISLLLFNHGEIHVLHGSVPLSVFSRQSNTINEVNKWCSSIFAKSLHFSDFLRFLLSIRGWERQFTSIPTLATKQFWWLWFILWRLRLSVLQWRLRTI